ncbi:MAG: proteasome ATPase [Corynebacterium sp.]|nr:proteasome ATPase [Corynebacterium sp.]
MAMEETRLRERNRALVEHLSAARVELKRLRSAIEELNTPPLEYGVFLGWTRPGQAEVFTRNRRLRVHVAPEADVAGVDRGMLVALGPGDVLVATAGYPTGGQIATVAEVLADGRAVVSSITGERSVVELSERARHNVQPGVTVLVDTRAHVASDVVAVTELKRLNLVEVPDVAWDDIGGLDAQIAAIRDGVELPFTHPELFHTYQLTPPKGLLLYGPPGCGKTLIAKAVANSLAERMGGGTSSYFLNIKGPELLSKFVGETERQIRVVFEQAREVAAEDHPVIVFFDEMESIFRTRGSGVSSDMETTVVPQLLAELDGVEQLSNVVIIGATNRPELIDPALLRPGRLDVKIHIGRPDRAGAADIFRRHLTENIPTDRPTSELIEHAVECLFAPGSAAAELVSGAMIANIVDRAKKAAIKAAIDGDPRGITAQQLAAAVAAELQETTEEKS